MESIKQQQLASLIKNEIGDIFIKEGRNFYSKAFVTLTNVRLTPDLLIARIYVSIFNTDSKIDTLNDIKENENIIRLKLGNKIKNKVRKIPHLEFYLDETLDEVDKMEELFKKITTDHTAPNEA